MKLGLRKDDYTCTRPVGTKLRNEPTTICILLLEFNPDSNVSFGAHYAVIENATLSKYNNNIETL